MKIHVVTPYFETEESWLRQGHASVRGQTVAAHHIMVCDGSAPAQIEAFQGTHIILQRNYKDYGNTPRLIGCYSAIARDADAIAFLDGDNWFQPDHLENLERFARDNRLDACSSARTLHRPDGSYMTKCPTVNGRPYIDTSSLLVMKSAFHHLLAWVLLGQDQAAVMDQHVWTHMKNAGARLGFLDKATICYRTRHASHYRLIGETPPPGAIDRVDLHGEHYQ
ncbi:glycosyltransferase [Acidisphaera sp. S103]|uniref:glycosyltransferase n=1 Tax=Acidisphaera sp. S103 TaxID=1747223 RepID=UPI00131AEDB9|nr:glycosyltransferase [Acidisphaera sp. S103]